MLKKEKPSKPPRQALLPAIVGTPISDASLGKGKFVSVKMRVELADALAMLVATDGLG